MRKLSRDSLGPAPRRHPRCAAALPAARKADRLAVRRERRLTTGREPDGDVSVCLYRSRMRFGLGFLCGTIGTVVLGVLTNWLSDGLDPVCGPQRCSEWVLPLGHSVLSGIAESGRWFTVLGRMLFLLLASVAVTTGLFIRRVADHFVEVDGDRWWATVGAGWLLIVGPLLAFGLQTELRFGFGPLLSVGQSTWVTVAGCPAAVLWYVGWRVGLDRKRSRSRLNGMSGGARA
jgi:hypothetical protein